MKSNVKILTNDQSANIAIVLKSIIIGLVAGTVTILYRYTLSQAEGFAFGFYDTLAHHSWMIPLGFMALAVLALIVGTFVKHNPMISGSGIPQVEGILKGHLSDRKPWWDTLMSKFIGGALAILAGLSLGREGPSIQLGASVAEGLGNKLEKGSLHRKILIASGASAGLAAAFNAPLAGVVFALEEIFRYFSPVILLSLMTSAVTADFISSQVFGTSTIFHFELIRQIPLDQYWLLIILGIFVGIMGVLYNTVLIKTKRYYASFKHVDLRIKLLVPFLMAGILGLIFPIVLGGGHRMVEALTLESGIWFLILLFTVKFLFSMISFGSGAPGGIFFPLIILGSTLGSIFASFAIGTMGIDQALFNNFIILAMAGFFTSIVRAPITGIVLIMEMTGNFAHILPLTIVAVVAYIVADLLKCPPVYDALLEDLIHNQTTPEPDEQAQKVIVELLVRHGSSLANTLVKEIDWPANSLLVGIKRADKQLIPDGKSKIKEGDYLLVLANMDQESQIHGWLEELNQP